MSREIKNKIRERLASQQMVFLATSAQDRPYVRPVTLIFNKERFFIATGSADAKAAQIATNPNVEICLHFKEGKYSGYIRARGWLETVHNTAVRKEIFESEEYIRYYWKDPEDTGFILYQMHWQKADYMHPGDDFSTTIDW